MRRYCDPDKSYEQALIWTQDRRDLDNNLITQEEAAPDGGRTRKLQSDPIPAYYLVTLPDSLRGSDLQSTVRIETRRGSQ